MKPAVGQRVSWRAYWANERRYGTVICVYDADSDCANANVRTDDGQIRTVFCDWLTDAEGTVLS